jgi:hypothetical protein
LSPKLFGSKIFLNDGCFDATYWLKWNQIPIAIAATNAVLKGNLMPCLRECLREIAFVTKKFIT